MPMFRNKPVVVEAIQWDGNQDNMKSFGSTNIFFTADTSLTIHTPEGAMRADLGDWIIKGVGGFYPCKDDVFQQLYEAA